LKVKPACDAVNIENFPSEIQPGAGATFHGFEVHLLQRHPATGDKLVLKNAPASDGVAALGEFRHQGL
jgi:hypothetical protein